MNQLLLGSRINSKAIDFGALECGYASVELDTFAMDNGGTKKELVGRTYAGVDGHCSFAVYLGRLGYCLELALRPGVQYSASESEYNLERALPIAANLVSTPLLVRVDSGFCSLKLMHSITAQACAVCRVCRLTERTIGKHGNILLLPDYVLQGWTTMLPQKFGFAKVIPVYERHYREPDTS
jgi:hypothetical protein